jgi:predicted MPP superfamily phosphohydrolase
MLFETRWFEITRRRHAIRGLHPDLGGVRIVQLTDIHHGPALSLEYVREVIAATNALKPDLILLTGDYVHRSPAYIDPVLRELAELRANIGIVGVLGNHDWWESAPLSRECFGKAGIPLIDNDRLFLSPDRKLSSDESHGGLCIAGVGDYIEDRIRLDRALRDVPEAMPRLLMSHNPDVVEYPPLVAARTRIDLMLAGHTHGGQVRIPGIGTPIVPSRFGSKYASGLVQGPVCPIYVSRGIGTTILPLRFRVAPEIAEIELVSA